MAWVKIPKENHPLFRDCLPRDRRVSTVNMFGGVAAKVNGRMFAGLFARSAVARLSESDRQAALAIDGTTIFDPMGNGRVMRDTVLLAESVMEDPEELRAWLHKAFDYTATLPAKKKPKATKPAGKKTVVKKTVVKKTAAKRSAAAERRSTARVPSRRR